MLKFSELQNLEGVELISKVEGVSSKLVKELVSKGVLQAKGKTILKGLEIDSPELVYTVEGGKLFATYGGKTYEDYVIGITPNSIKVVSGSSIPECANIEIESVDGNVLNCRGGFALLCQVDMFDME